MSRNTLSELFSLSFIWNLTVVYQRKTRGSTLVDMHAKGSSSKKDEGAKPEGIWDHSRDMSLGGRLMDDKTRSKMLQDAKSLGDRFGTGKSGGFL